MPVFADYSLYGNSGLSSSSLSYSTLLLLGRGGTGGFSSSNFSSSNFGVISGNYYGTGRRYSPLLPTILESGLSPKIPRRIVPRSSPVSYTSSPVYSTPRTSPAYNVPRPVRVDTDNIDVSTPRNPPRRPQQQDEQQSEGGVPRSTIKRGRTVVRIHTKNLKENPNIDNKEKRNKMTPGERLKEKFMIRDKDAERKKRDEEHERMRKLEIEEAEKRFRRLMCLDEPLPLINNKEKEFNLAPVKPEVSTVTDDLEITPQNSDEDETDTECDDCDSDNSKNSTRKKRRKKGSQRVKSDDENKAPVPPPRNKTKKKQIESSIDDTRRQTVKRKVTEKLNSVKGGISKKKTIKKSKVISVENKNIPVVPTSPECTKSPKLFIENIVVEEERIVLLKSPPRGKKFAYDEKQVTEVTNDVNKQNETVQANTALEKVQVDHKSSPVTSILQEKTAPKSPVKKTKQTDTDKSPTKSSDEKSKSPTGLILPESNTNNITKEAEPSIVARNCDNKETKLPIDKTKTEVIKDKSPPKFGQKPIVVKEKSPAKALEAEIKNVGLQKPKSDVIDKQETKLPIDTNKVKVTNDKSPPKTVDLPVVEKEKSPPKKLEAEIKKVESPKLTPDDGNKKEAKSPISNTKPVVTKDKLATKSLLDNVEVKEKSPALKSEIDLKKVELTKHSEINIKLDELKSSQVNSVASLQTVESPTSKLPAKTKLNEKKEQEPKSSKSKAGLDVFTFEELPPTFSNNYVTENSRLETPEKVQDVILLPKPLVQKVPKSSKSKAGLDVFSSEELAQISSNSIIDNIINAGETRLLPETGKAAKSEIKVNVNTPKEQVPKSSKSKAGLDVFFVEEPAPKSPKSNEKIATKITAVKLPTKPNLNATKELEPKSSKSKAGLDVFYDEEIPPKSPIKSNVNTVKEQEPKSSKSKAGLDVFYDEEIPPKSPTQCNVNTVKEQVPKSSKSKAGLDVFYVEESPTNILTTKTEVNAQPDIVFLQDSKGNTVKDKAPKSPNILKITNKKDEDQNMDSSTPKSPRKFNFNNKKEMSPVTKSEAKTPKESSTAATLLVNKTDTENQCSKDKNVSVINIEHHESTVLTIISDTVLESGKSEIKTLQEITTIIDSSPVALLTICDTKDQDKKSPISKFNQKLVGKKEASPPKSPIKLIASEKLEEIKLEAKSPVKKLAVENVGKDGSPPKSPIKLSVANKFENLIQESKSPLTKVNLGKSSTPPASPKQLALGDPGVLEPKIPITTDLPLLETSVSTCVSISITAFTPVTTATVTLPKSPNTLTTSSPRTTPDRTINELPISSTKVIETKLNLKTKSRKKKPEPLKLIDTKLISSDISSPKPYQLLNKIEAKKIIDNKKKISSNIPKVDTKIVSSNKDKQVIPIKKDEVKTKTPEEIDYYSIWGHVEAEYEPIFVSKKQEYITLAPEDETTSLKTSDEEIKNKVRSFAELFDTSKRNEKSKITDVKVKENVTNLFDDKRHSPKKQIVTNDEQKVKDFTETKKLDEQRESPQKQILIKQDEKVKEKPQKQLILKQEQKAKDIDTKKEKPNTEIKSVETREENVKKQKSDTQNNTDAKISTLECKQSCDKLNAPFEKPIVKKETTPEKSKTPQNEIKKILPTDEIKNIEPKVIKVEEKAVPKIDQKKESSPVINKLAEKSVDLLQSIEVPALENTQVQESTAKDVEEKKPKCKIQKGILTASIKPPDPHRMTVKKNNKYLPPSVTPKEVIVKPEIKNKNIPINTTLPADQSELVASVEKTLKDSVIPSPKPTSKDDNKDTSSPVPLVKKPEEEQKVEPKVQLKKTPPKIETKKEVILTEKIQVQTAESKIVESKSKEITPVINKEIKGTKEITTEIQSKEEVKSPVLKDEIIKPTVQQKEEKSEGKKLEIKSDSGENKPAVAQNQVKNITPPKPTEEKTSTGANKKTPQPKPQINQQQQKKIGPPKPNNNKFPAPLKPLFMNPAIAKLQEALLAKNEPVKKPVPHQLKKVPAVKNIAQETNDEVRKPPKRELNRLSRHTVKNMIFKPDRVSTIRHMAMNIAQQASLEAESDSEEDSDTETESSGSDTETEESVQQSKLDRTSTSSEDSGFGSTHTSPLTNKNECSVNCHRKCEKHMPNLCGVNQKLLAEALSSLKKGRTNPGSTKNAGAEGREGTSPHPTRRLSTSLSSDSESGEEGSSRRFTPPARTIPRFRKYTVEDYQFLKVLGKGSFGKVLLAELRGTECYYAVKCLKKDVVLEDDDVECTLIERKVLALGTRHPYLCHLFCTFQTESHLFFVMEYLNGGDLMFHIQQSGRFEQPRASFYAAEIVSGLKFLHKKGIVYRDLKLDNILLDYEGHVRIADFGMCKLQIYLDRTADTFCGTPDYMAPEIIRGLHYNQCVDWWSFGVLLYEMLIGQSPFNGCDEDELFWSICNEQPYYPRFLSKEAQCILTLLLEKDSSRRLGTPDCPAGDVYMQPFFKNIDWGALDRKELEPPFKPRVQHALDVQYFDSAFTQEAAKLTPVDKEILQSMDQTQFHGFSYTNPNACNE